MDRREALKVMANVVVVPLVGGTLMTSQNKPKDSEIASEIGDIAFHIASEITGKVTFRRRDYGEYESCTMNARCINDFARQIIERYHNVFYIRVDFEGSKGSKAVCEWSKLENQDKWFRFISFCGKGVRDLKEGDELIVDIFDKNWAEL